MELKTLFVPTAVQTLLLALQGMLYLGVQRLQGSYHDMARSLDSKIPLRPRWIFIYILWFPLIFLYPIYLYCCSISVYYDYIFAVLLDIVISLIIYLSYPTSFTRPPAPSEGVTGFVFKWIRIGNYRGLNCMPSMHCSMCFIIIFTVISCGAEAAVGIKAAICTLAGLIVCSTVLTKQHVIIDVLTAFPLAAVCLGLSKLL